MEVTAEFLRVVVVAVLHVVVDVGVAVEGRMVCGNGCELHRLQLEQQQQQYL